MNEPSFVWIIVGNFLGCTKSMLWRMLWKVCSYHLLEVKNHEIIMAHDGEDMIRFYNFFEFF